jgi:hypothetical protein
MSVSKLSTRIAFLLLTVLLVPTAEAQICLNGYVGTTVYTGVGQNYLADQRTIGDAYACQVQSVFTGSISSSQRYDIVPSDPLAGRQVGEASLFAYASFGGLRGAISAQTAVNNYINNLTGAGGQLEETWNDTVTFHTASASGADFNFSITLDDGLGTTLTQGMGYARNSSASAGAISYFFINGGGDPFLSVIDGQNDYVPSGGTGPATPLSNRNHPAQRTVSALVHVYDGEQLNLVQTLRIQAGVNGGGSAYADASDTAFFNLSSSDASASYTAASGTVYLASGDPFAVSAVPEPAEWALMVAGVGAIGWLSRRRHKGR